MQQVAFVREEMASATLSFLTESLWQDKAFSDIDLDFSGHVFRLHRLLLWQSPFLRRLLEKTPHTTKTVQLSINDAHVTTGALEVCLSTFYGLEPVLDEDNILSVLATAFILELDTLCDACVTFLPNIVTPSLFLALHAFNETWDGKGYGLMVTDVLEKYLCRTAFFELRSSLHKLPREQLKTLFSSDALWVPTEADRFQLIMEVYESTRQMSGEETEMTDSVLRTEAKRSLSFRSVDTPVRETQTSPYEIGRSASSEQPMRQDSHHFMSVSRVNSEPAQTGYDLNNCKFGLPSADCEFLESVLTDDKIFYSCFSFQDLIKARSQAQNMGLRKVVRCIENSLWTKSLIESIIIAEAARLGDLRSCRSFDKSTNSDTVWTMRAPDDHQSHTFRYSTEIKDIEEFRRTRDFTSDQFYFYGSLYRVVLTIRFDEPSQSHFIGMYLQRTMTSNVDSCQFCDPRSNVNAHVEFIAGTRLLEMIELDGRLEAPHNNKGYSRFLYDSELLKYLSPSGSLRVTAILRLIFESSDVDRYEGA